MASRAKRSKARAVVAPAKKSKLSFFGDAFAELKKVHWPTRQEAVRLSLLVLVICVVVGAFLGVVDLGFSALIKGLFLGG